MKWLKINKPKGRFNIRIWRLFADYIKFSKPLYINKKGQVNVRLQKWRLDVWMGNDRELSIEWQK